ncbi:hypothetical protein J2S71_001608 [Olsenella profusa DSM 13989]|uniref:Uncharacterized protein n=1 Tax=Olsenella profusa F0195 TaxID=1125712 RepID=U2V4X5_9ACTN|nr:hypothetical protein HMPREF1316_2338 [Olsenella profusa F0195]MDP9859912.1 hypothetical protein [Olsenella profusa DSM 13989]
MMNGLAPEAGCVRLDNVDMFCGDVPAHVGRPAAHVPKAMAHLRLAEHDGHAPVVLAGNTFVSLDL